MRTFRSAFRVLVVALALVIAAGVTSAALAAPAEPTLGLAALQQKLTASGPLDGYLKTVVSGSTITTIPLTVLAITGDGNVEDSFIVFEATGPLIDAYGGLAAGMSGSPVYIDDGGNDELVGALSYGDTFTLGGTGLATPIEAMENLEVAYAPKVETLDHPIITSNGVVDRLIVTDHPEAYAGAAAQGALVAQPLSGVYIGGISQNSRPYKKLAAELAKHSLDVVQLAAPLSGSSSGDEDTETTLTAGAAVTALESRGDLWVGDLGTVTYATTDTVLAFGHSANDDGATNLYMTNATIDSVWPSIYRPYKLGRPTAVRGTITQDRGAGILGVIGCPPAETTVTAEATEVESGQTTTSVSYIPRWVLDGNSDYGDLPGVAAYVAGASLFDQYETPGSAVTTTTIVFRDTDADTTYTAVIPDFFDDDTDIPSAITNDVDWAVGELQNTLGDDAYHFEILSIDLTSRISTHRRYARIVGVTVPNGVHTGLNDAQVSLLIHGVVATQTLDVTFTVPPGMSTNGSLVAENGEDAADQTTGGSSIQQLIDELSGSDDTSTGPRLSIEQIAEELNDSPVLDDVLAVRYVAAGDDSSDDEGDDYSDMSLASTTPKVPASLMETSTLPWVLDGTAHGYTTVISARLAHGTTACQGSNRVSGVIDGADDPGVISIFGKPANSPVESLLGTTNADPDSGAFSFNLPRLSVNTTIRVHVDSTLDGYSSANKSLAAKVHAKVWLDSSSRSARSHSTVKLTAQVWPADNAGGRATFEYRSNGSWHRIATRTLGSGSNAHATASWKVMAGSTQVRVRFLGSTMNQPTASKTLTIHGS